MHRLIQKILNVYSISGTKYSFCLFHINRIPKLLYRRFPNPLNAANEETPKVRRNVTKKGILLFKFTCIKKGKVTVYTIFFAQFHIPISDNISMKKKTEDTEIGYEDYGSLPEG